ncbi:MAG: lytic transglycosylase domain-containing protein [Verrucomicrobiota bacterium]
MVRFLAKTALFLLLALVAIAGGIVGFSTDPLYTATDWLSLGRYQRYESEIQDIARKHKIDPLLIRAIVWRESDFHPDKTGTSGERGLMQVSEGAAEDWVRANKVENFVPTDLFAPRTNLEIGTWYLKQALQHWASKDDPIPFALAEYNAGKRRVDRWIESTKLGSAVTADDLRTSIDFPKTRHYVESIIKRRSYYEAESKKAAH